MIFKVFIFDVYELKVFVFKYFPKVSDFFKYIGSINMCFKITLHVILSAKLITFTATSPNSANY